MIRIKRIYEPADSQDGLRVLVDRNWPRGVKKSDDAVEIWLKEIAPSSDLRRWFGHDPDKWKEFRRRYAEEVSREVAVLLPIMSYLEEREGTVTLLYAARDETHNNAAVLRELFSSGHE